MLDEDIIPMDVWLQSKAWPVNKKGKYLKVLAAQKTQKTNAYVGNFKTMVKTGEEYHDTKTLEFDSHGRCINQESRPRNISVPDDIS